MWVCVYVLEGHRGSSGGGVNYWWDSSEYAQTQQWTSFNIIAYGWRAHMAHITDSTQTQLVYKHFKLTTSVLIVTSTCTYAVLQWWQSYCGTYSRKSCCPCLDFSNPESLTPTSVFTWAWTYPGLFTSETVCMIPALCCRQTFVLVGNFLCCRTLFLHNNSVLLYHWHFLQVLARDKQYTCVLRDCTSFKRKQIWTGSNYFELCFEEIQKYVLCFCFFSLLTEPRTDRGCIKANKKPKWITLSA